jgi:hypothetical protein
MKTKRKRVLAFGVFFAVLMMACNLVTPAEPTESGLVLTQAHETFQAHLTQMASTPTDVPPTATSVPPTATHTTPPTATNPPPTPTSTSVPCDWAQFVKDVTVKDGTVFLPGTRFTKTWRLKNVGGCTWTKDYDLVFVNGDGMNAYASVPFPDTAVPGETIDLSVKLTAPESGGNYKGYWQLRNANGIVFGYGANANSSFWVEIDVVEVDDNSAFNFALNYCLARWQTGLIRDLSCPSKHDDKNGFVQFLSKPDMESHHDDEPTIWAHPDANLNGWITGEYPPIKVKDNDRFRAWVGCLNDSEGCKVTFVLSYQVEGGPVGSLGSWYEEYDGEITDIDIDMSDLAGESVTFILGVVAVDGKVKNSDAFWFNPHIQRGS